MKDQKIAIIGGGIVGSTAAYYLSRKNYDVTLYDHGVGQATRASAGIICPWFSKRRNKAWYFLVSKGAEFYRQFMEDLSQDGYKTDGIFQEDTALLPRKKDKDLQFDLDQAAKKRPKSPSIGYVKSLTSQEIKKIFPLYESNLPASWIQGGARIDGLALIQTLQQAVKDRGKQVIHDKVSFQRSPQGKYLIESHDFTESYDQILLAVGPWLPELLKPFGLACDIRPQKGQLLSFYDSDWINKHWPVIMPPGEVDIIPFNNGEIVIGASHEDNQGFDLKPDAKVLNELLQHAYNYVPALKNRSIHSTRVGTRAYTSTYDILVGAVPQLNNVWAISGLGSSGLTSGPYLANQWVQLLDQGNWEIDASLYPIEQYIYPQSMSK